MEDSLPTISNPQTHEQQPLTSPLAEKEIGNHGLTKRILRHGNSWQTPFPGDEVEVHYSGHVEDGSLGSSHENGTPFKFKLGQGEVIKGLDEGVVTMKKGEKAVFKVPPHLAYGEAGFSPLIPPHSTVIFDVEMISWSTIRDITGDGGVLKKIITEGDGWATPKDGDEVSVKYEAKLENGTVHSTSENAQLHVGDGKLCPAIHKAVKTMRRNEKAELSVRFSYRFTDGFEVEFGREEARSSNITILLELLSWRSVVDVLGDKKILKKVISAGEGFVYPNEGSLVKVIYVGKREDGVIFEQKGSNDEPFEYMCLEDQVEESLDKAIMTMKKGEKSQVFVFSDHVQESPEASDTVFANPKVIYEVELLDFTKAVKCIEFNHNFSDEEKQQTKALLSSCNLNNAACKLKLEDYVGAATLCTKVLEIDQVNTKALFRRAQAYLQTSDLDKAEADSRRALTIDPNNREIKLVYQMIKTKQKEHALYQAQLFGTMISKMV
uniref:peptidylprolyl isomerase n=1 Tax=Chenopodium quinoa TaxID=63459 RepID=A0A803MJ16_CHEQI